MLLARYSHSALLTQYQGSGDLDYLSWQLSYAGLKENMTRYFKIFTAVTTFITIGAFSLPRTAAALPLPTLASLTQQACTWQNYTADTAYDAVAQIACHNCYEKQYAAKDYDVLNTTKTVEI